jgi:type II secretory pathway pseudopilin PulG
MLFVISLVGLLSVLALPGFLRARGAAQASSALGTMRAINSGQLSYAITCGLGF